MLVSYEELTINIEVLGNRMHRRQKYIMIINRPNRSYVLWFGFKGMRGVFTIKHSQYDGFFYKIID